MRGLIQIRFEIRFQIRLGIESSLGLGLGLGLEACDGELRPHGQSEASPGGEGLRLWKATGDPVVGPGSGQGWGWGEG